MRAIGHQPVEFPKERDLKKQYELQVQEFVKQLMENQGFYIKAPVQIMRKAMPDQDAIQEAQNVWKHTCELLEMMGIPYETNLTNFSIRVIEPDDDWTERIKGVK